MLKRRQEPGSSSEGCCSHWETARGRKTGEGGPHYDVCLPGWERPGQRMRGGRAESHRQVLPCLWRLRALSFLRLKHCLKQIFPRSLLMWPGVGAHGGGRAGEESRNQWGPGKAGGRFPAGLPSSQRTSCLPL